jgi:hypothetical protein
MVSSRPLASRVFGLANNGINRALWWRWLIIHGEVDALDMCVGDLGRPCFDYLALLLLLLRLHSYRMGDGRSKTLCSEQIDPLLATIQMHSLRLDGHGEWKRV